LLAAMRGRWPCAGVVLASAGIGLPPLLVTAAAAGAVRMRRIDFALTVALGRTARFMAIAWPVMALRP
jgi:membrane protein YqaA with SNARE-associated domain